MELSKELSVDKKEIDVNNMNANEALAMAQRIQQQDLGTLDGAIADIEESKQLGGTMLLQLDQQNEQLDHCISMVDEIDSELDVANKELSAIARRLFADKIVMILIIIVVLIIIGCSALFTVQGLF